MAASVVVDTARSHSNNGNASAEAVRLVEYEDERQLSDIMSLVDRDLSEPYSIFTYRYFLHNWPGLCFMVRKELTPVNSHLTSSLPIQNSIWLQ